MSEGKLKAGSLFRRVGIRAGDLIRSSQGTRYRRAESILRNGQICSREAPGIQSEGRRKDKADVQADGTAAGAILSAEVGNQSDPLADTRLAAKKKPVPHPIPVLQHCDRHQQSI
jgi:hypothetical protein